MTEETPKKTVTQAPNPRRNKLFWPIFTGLTAIILMALATWITDGFHGAAQLVLSGMVGYSMAWCVSLDQHNKFLASLNRKIDYAKKVSDYDFNQLKKVISALQQPACIALEMSEAWKSENSEPEIIFSYMPRLTEALDAMSCQINHLTKGGRA